MSTITNDDQPAIIDRLFEAVRVALSTVTPPTKADEADIDWEDGEPETAAPVVLG